MDRQRSASAVSSHALGSARDEEIAQELTSRAEDYELLEECGRGVSAVVWRAVFKPSQQIVAVKLMDLENMNCSLEEIIKEAHVMRQQNHPNVLKLYTSFSHKQNLWMIMPFVSGGSVLNIMKYAYPEGLEEPVIATIMKEVLRGLDYMHKQGAIHRDVKAGNILLDSSGRVLLADFGVASTLERTSSWGASAPQNRNTFVGTPCWMAPEVMEQTQGYNTLADIWSFGITLLELAHGHAPFARYPPMKVLLMTIQNPPPTLENSSDHGKKHFSKAMRDIVAKCLVKDPAKRPTASQLLEHKFFKTAHDAGYLVRHLLAELPDVADRVRRMRAGHNKVTGAHDKEALAQNVAASQEAYIKGVSAWNFDVAALKAAAAKEGPGGEAPAHLPAIAENGPSGGLPGLQSHASTRSEELELDPEGAPLGGMQRAPSQDAMGALSSPTARGASLRSASASALHPQPPAHPANMAGSKSGSHLQGSGGSGNLAAAAAKAGVLIKPGHKKQGRFEVYEGNEPPPMSPSNNPTGAALMENARGPPTPEGLSRGMQGAESGLSGLEPFSTRTSEGGEAKEPQRRKGRFQIVDDGGKGQQQPSSSRSSLADHPHKATPTAAMLLPVLREVSTALTTQSDTVRELLAAVQDAERGKHSALTMFLSEVAGRSERHAREENERLRSELVQLKEENTRLREKLAGGGSSEHGQQHFRRTASEAA